MSEAPTTRIDVILAYAAPLIVLEPAPDGVGMPQKLGRGTFDIDSRTVPVSHGSARVSNYSLPDAQPDMPTFLLSVRVERQGILSESNVEHADTIITLIDNIEFSLHQTVQVVGLSTLDVTPPLGLGEERETFTYAAGGTALGGRLLAPPGDMRWSYHGANRISLTSNQQPPPRIAIARWWYLKALSSSLAIDSFLALWTALEVLRRADDVSIRESLRLHCGHIIDRCPTCSKDTTREINGPTMKAYLSQNGVSDSDANKMWRLRQAVHGKNLFGPTESRDLENLLGLLRLVVFTSIKQHLNLQAEDAPIATVSGGPVIGWMSAGGHSLITPDDIELDELLNLA